MTGRKFGKWTVIEFYGRKENKKDTNIYWLCECSCENHTQRLIRDNCLIKGETKSCGCEWHRNFEKYNNSNRDMHAMSDTRFYRKWEQMKRRCYDEKIDSYSRYGGRGIKVCDRWRDTFSNFKEDMFESYLRHVEEFGESDTSLDRIDPNKDYNRENCRWATNEEQSNNKTNNKYIEYNGKIQSVSMWCKELGLNYNKVIRKINNGSSIEEFLINNNK